MVRQVIVDVGGLWRDEITIESEGDSHVRIKITQLCGTQLFEYKFIETHMIAVQITYTLFHPLHHSAQNDNILAIRKWLVAGITVDIRSKYNATPLMYACRGKSINAIQELIKYGADVNACNTYGNCVLFYSAIGGSVNVLQLLIEAGCDLTCDGKAERVKQILFLAKRYNNHEFIAKFTATGLK